MKIPKRIESLKEEGLVDSVICQLMSGKEAMIYVVRCGESIRCARAIEKGSRYGRNAQEEVWQSTEVDMLYRLAAVGVRVPKFYNFFAGVLLMELIADNKGDVAPRLNDLILTEEQVREYHKILISQIVRILCAGVIHGDLSQYNILLGSEGPVIMDFPQAVNAANNNSAFSLFKRDIDNVTAYFGRFASELANKDYGAEIWAYYKSGKCIQK